MESMFSFCIFLTSLNINKFQTSRVNDMTGMFYYCPLLMSKNLSSFDTSQVTSMAFMFEECRSLISLDLSNFLTTSVEYFLNMFYNSTKLEYLNLSEFSSIIKGKELSYDDAFSNTPDYLIYCINESKPQSDIFLNQLKAKKCSMNYCLSDWESKRKKYVKENDLCIGDCSMISFMNIIPNAFLFVQMEQIQLKEIHFYA